jgi:hypothetical protein
VSASATLERVAYGRFAEGSGAELLSKSDSAALFPIAGAELLLRSRGDAIRL